MKNKYKETYPGELVASKYVAKITFEPDLQPIKVKDYKPNRVVAWIDKKTGESKTISDSKWKWKKKKQQSKI